MLQAVKNALLLPDLRRKIVFTLLILIIYRAATQVPVPGVDKEILNQFLNSGSGGATIIQFMDLLSGGTLSRFSVLAMGVYPYITASIIMQLLTPMIPALEELSKEGEQGRNKINQYTHWLAVPLAALQAYGQVVIIQQSIPGIIPDFGFASNPLGTTAIIVSMTAGSMFAVWLGELITEQGIGNGVSIIIFGGIVAQMPGRIWQFVQLEQYGQLIAFSLITFVTILGIVIVTEGQRRIPVQYGKRVRGTKVYGGQSSHIPLKVNSAGMIPLIFAQSILIFPSSIASFFAGSESAFIAGTATFIVQWFSPRPDAWPYWITYFMMVALFTFFYTDIIFKQQNLAESLQRQGGFIPGLRPGKTTEDYLNTVMRRITLIGAVFLGVVAILPWIVGIIPGLGSSGGGTATLLITSTGLLIVVGVGLDTMKQLEAQLLMRNYEGFIK
ncbi:MAG TPA: preprotein translocase subunit SecY [Chloroflexi bacterium]|nr:preprotein translocase subunit SecY [Chloroflexota bacterium]